MKEILYVFKLIVIGIVVLSIAVVGLVQFGSILEQSRCEAFATINTDLDIQYFRESLFPVGCMINIDGNWFSVGLIRINSDGTIGIDMHNGEINND